MISACEWGPRPSANSRPYWAAARSRSRRHPGGVELGSVLHRLDDFDVASAAADVAAQRQPDVVLAGARVAAQQAGRCHDEAGRAVAALGAELFVTPASHCGK